MPEIGEGLFEQLLEVRSLRYPKPMEEGRRICFWITYRLVDASTRTDDIRASEFFTCDAEHAL